MSIFVSAGEVSGDHYLASLVNALRNLGYCNSIWGMAGSEAEKNGVTVCWRGDSIQRMGIVEILGSIPELLKQAQNMVTEVMMQQPECVIVVDSPDFHLRLIKKLRKAGYTGKIVYIATPTVWAWRSSRIKYLRSYVDLCLPIFGFEHDFISKSGCKSRWCGTPLLDDYYKDERNRDGAFPLGKKNNIVAFMPGSRSSEIEVLLPILIKVADELKQDGIRSIFSVAPGLNEKTREKYIEVLQKENLEYYTESGKDLMKTAAFVVAASGTISVEALIIGCYMIVVYKVNKLSAFIGRFLLKIKMFAMANILCGRMVYPELIQEDCTVEKIVAKCREWIDSDASERYKVKADLEKAKLNLGHIGVYDFWAERILEEISNG